MTDPSPAGQWDQRYGTAGCWYRTQPDDFPTEHAGALPPGGRMLCLAEGEGRNAVFLATRGFEVVAVDSSAVGLAKAERLAQGNQVSIKTVQADLSEYALGHDARDAVVSIWSHLPPALRSG